MSSSHRRLVRHEDEQRVRRWLLIAAGVPGFIGFAVGRTTFWDPLVDYRAQKITHDMAVVQIAASYQEWVDLFEKEKREPRPAMAVLSEDR